ncbi:Right handed beta helix region [Pricia antarctica]|uniref:Right handed beta helix region n=1 Tax=Pricia antarctica TaxID=641691 RepID=A0A1G7FA10_9FLAO|nr:right-handed parallel beta-helix repeat-containing protein [Pricia antarctica]SDE72716.1 Right handed beta helix region [Pricia antarctica]
MIKFLYTAAVYFFLMGAIHAQVINVGDHGIRPGKDVTLDVNLLLESLKGKKNVTLFFPKGQYEFYPENAVEAYRAVANHDNSIKRMAFPLFGFENLTLDGNGSTFMFHGKICPIIIDGSTNTVLKNFSIDWEKSFVNELKVIENDTNENSFIAEVANPKFGFEVKDNEILFNHYDWQDGIGQNIAFDPKTRAPIWNTKDYFLKYSGSDVKIVKLDYNKAKFTNITKETPPIGTLFATYGPSPGGNRFAQAIHASNSKDIFIQNVTVYAAGGMALIAERCENITLNKLVVTSREIRNFSTRADAAHFLGCKGLIKVENCLLQHMLDDGINVHGAYVNIDENRGDNTFMCSISHQQQWGLTFAEPGDNIMFTSRETVLPISATTVDDIKILNDNRMLITVSEVPENLPTGPLSFENITWNPDIVMTKNIVRENRARSALISTKGKVLIENNYFSSQMNGILIEGDNKAWYESGGVRDITINNNTFVDIGFGDGEGYPLFVSPMLTDEQRLGDEKYHQNIRFTNNVIKSYNGLLVHARSVKGLLIEGNTIDLSTDYPTGSKLPPISLDYCEDVTITKNTFNGFTWPLRIEQSDNNTMIHIKKNKGLSDK